MTGTPEFPDAPWGPWTGGDAAADGGRGGGPYDGTGAGGDLAGDGVTGGDIGGGTGGGGLGDGPAPLGGYVRRGGLAVLNRHELVVPFEGSEAEVVLAEQDGRHDIHVHLPVTVEVVGGPDPRQVRAVVDEALRRVRLALDAHESWG